MDQSLRGGTSSVTGLEHNAKIRFLLGTLPLVIYYSHFSFRMSSWAAFLVGENGMRILN